MIKLCTILNDSQFNYFEVMIESYYKTQRVKHPWLLFDCGLSDENLRTITSKYPQIEIKEIQYHRYSGIGFNGPGRRSEWSHDQSRRGIYNAAYRFDIFLEKDPEWLFYVDSDMLFVSDVSSLFDTRDRWRNNLMDHSDVIAAPRTWEVYDNIFSTGKQDTDGCTKQYINAGFMGLRNTIRTAKVHAQLVKMCSDGHYNGNQQPLNEIIVSNNWKMSLLTPWYNMQTEMWKQIGSAPGLELEKTKILHFTGPGSPTAFESRGDFYKSLGSHYHDNKAGAKKIYDTYVRPAVVEHNLDVSC